MRSSRCLSQVLVALAVGAAGAIAHAQDTITISGQVTDPDGSVRELGPTAFSQSFNRTPTTRAGVDLNPGTTQLNDVYSLTTGDPGFMVSFDDFGHHVITMTGEIDDIWGDTYTGGGTYDLWVAHAISVAIAPHAGDWRNIYRDAYAFRAPVYVRRGTEREGLVPSSAELQDWGVDEVKMKPLDLSRGSALVQITNFLRIRCGDKPGRNIKQVF